MQDAYSYPWSVIHDADIHNYCSLSSLLGILYEYLAKGVGRSQDKGAFRAISRGYNHWASGRIERVEINTRHPNLCHVQCIMKPSMKVGKYHVYVLLDHEGTLASIKKATYECPAG
jgi:hypothetical protein